MKKILNGEFPFSGSQRERGVPCPRRGSLLIEATVALFLLVVIASVLTKSSIDVIVPRQKALISNLSDAYMTYEVAYANRESFDVIEGAGSPWPVGVANAKKTTVVIGTLPSGSQVEGEVSRFRVANTSPLGAGAVDLSDLGITIWELQSHLVYQIGGETYVKSRTIVRSQ